MPLKIGEIPKTRAIARLPTTSAGMPVPWATLYATSEGENPSTLETTALGTVLHCPCKLGVGRPRFGQPCPNRQRNAMRHRRCVICGTKIHPSVPLVFVGGEFNRLPPLQGEHWTSIEPPAHPACAAYSALACPRLIRDLDEVQVAVCRDYDVWKHVVIGPRGDGSMVAQAMPLSQPVPIGAVDIYVAVPHIKLAQLTSLERWMHTAAPATYRALYTQEYARV